MRPAAVMALLGIVVSAPCVRGAETAREILDRRKALDDTTRHWTDRQQRMRFVIVGGSGGERRRELSVYERRYPGDEIKSVVFFHAPAEVKGTALLAFTHKGRQGEQWLYLPALARVRVISGSARREKFVGTDLTYHDLDLIQEMTSWTEDDAPSKLLGDADVGGTPVHDIELTPRREDIGYEKIVVALGREDLVPRRIEFYEDGEQPLKRITQSEVRSVGPIPVAHRIEVQTPAAKSSTTIEVSEVKFDQGLKDDLFTQRTLERGPP
jgi:outer membrane lipoprotein-sorting protein